MKSFVCWLARFACVLSVALVASALGGFGSPRAAHAATTYTVVGWGNNGAGQATTPNGLTDVTAISAGTFHSLALTSDGIVVQWGGNRNGQGTVPADLTNVTAIAAGVFHSLALKRDGTVVAWGYNFYGQTNVPPNLTGVTAIAAGADHSLALTNDGTVVGWGGNYVGQRDAPAHLTGVKAIAAGYLHSLALTRNGAVVGWGENYYGQTAIPAALQGVTVTAIAAGGYHSLALTSDGTVVGWGDNHYGETTIPEVLKGVKVVAIAAGGSHSLALTSNGTVVAWGDNYYGQAPNPSNLSGVTAIAAGAFHSLALAPTPPNQTITFDTFPEKRYGDPPFTLTASATSGLPVSFSASGACSVSGTTLTITGAGSCSIIASQAGDSTYNAAPDNVRQFYINSATLTITPNNFTKVYGDSNPTLTGTITGLVNGDNITASYTTQATTSSDVGNYGIVATLNDPDNRLAKYYVVNNPGTLSVTPAPLTVTANNATKIYGNPNPTFSGTISGLLNGDNITANYTTQATASSDVGNYNVVASLNDPNNRLSNYTITRTPGVLTITPAPLSITANDATKAYGAALPQFSARYAGFVLGQSAAVLGGSLSFSTTASQSSDIGTYPITPSGFTSTNYAIAYHDGTLSVNSTGSTLSVAASQASSVIGQSLTFTATLGSPTTPVGSVTFSIDGSAQTPVAISSTGSATFATAALGIGNHIIGATYSGDPNIGNSTATATVSVGYGLCEPAPNSRLWRSGSTIPFSTYLCDAAKKPLAMNATTMLTATGVDGVLLPAKSKTAFAFVRRMRLGKGIVTQGYRYKLVTRSLKLSKGQHVLNVTVSGDPVPHTLTFFIK